ncbi:MULTISPECIES: hypothetical protein [Gordonia]|uniref:hypothetical protein n=1 Tax=Gordonia TaxID=2053 RepID=UPI001F2F032D|nr:MULTISPECIES: hypothetical protein [Gordonia]MCR8898702.1 hypothetical protein [Gordonia sp. GONU]MCZ0914960.1 hypothetical protein [Gordonia amicalis]
MSRSRSATTGRPTSRQLLSGRALLYRMLGGGPHVDELDRIPIDRVRDIDVTVDLEESQEDLELAWPERWCRDHIISDSVG